jgi:capsular polysaccharide export protein
MALEEKEPVVQLIVGKFLQSLPDPCFSISKMPIPGTVQGISRMAAYESGRKERVYLFLQGHPSGLWKDQFNELSSRGALCLKINLCLADSIFWFGGPSLPYRGSLEDWPAWLEGYCRRMGVTDILYFSDQQPYHKAARAIAKPLGIACWAIEFGYLRPDWITLERDGMGPLSHFRRDPEHLFSVAAGTEKPDLVPRFQHPFAREAFGEVAFNLLMVFGRPFFPRYVSDKAFWPVLEYLGWLPVLAVSRRDKRRAEACERALSQSKASFNLVAMQMRGDYQVRAASPFTDLQDFVDEVLRSFSAHAPRDRQIVFKLHPLESGYHNWSWRIHHLARKYGVSDRVIVIRGGDLHRLLQASRGVVLVNSTVGLHALRLGVPTCALGEALYGIAGLCHQGGIDTFWTAPEPVDRRLYDAFERALTGIQVKGSFFNPEGRRRAVSEIADRLEAAQVGVPDVAAN